MLPIKYLLILGNPLCPQKKCDPLTALALGSAVVGGIGNLLGQDSANKTSIGIAQQNREWQSEENQKARDYQTEMWNRQNEYNSPANQRRLLAEGGYNPFVMQPNGSVSGAGSPGVPSMQGAPNSPHIEPINPLGGVSGLMNAIAVSNQKEQVDSTVESNKANIVKTLSEAAIDAYDKLGQKGFSDLMSKISPVLESLTFEGSRSDILFNELIRNNLSQRFNQDMDSLNKEFNYELSKRWSDKERSAAWENVRQSTKNLSAQVELWAIEGNYTKERAKAVASEVAKNFAEAFQAKKVGDYYEVSSQQMSIINDMMDLDLKDKEADFAFNTLVRKYKKEIPNRGVALGLFQGSLGAQSTRLSVESNKFLQYGKQVTSMVGDLFKVNVGVSSNSTRFNNVTPSSPSQMFYSGDGFYMNNGTLLKGNW